MIAFRLRSDSLDTLLGGGHLWRAGMCIEGAPGDCSCPPQHGETPCTMGLCGSAWTGWDKSPIFGVRIRLQGLTRGSGSFPGGFAASSREAGAGWSCDAHVWCGSLHKARSIWQENRDQRRVWWLSWSLVFDKHSSHQMAGPKFLIGRRMSRSHPSQWGRGSIPAGGDHQLQTLAAPLERQAQGFFSVNSGFFL